MPTDITTLAIECKTNDAINNVRNFSGELERGRKTADKFKKTIAGAFSTAAVARFVKSSIASYTALENSSRVFAAVYRDNAMTAKKALEQFRSEMHLTTGQAQKMLGMTGNLLTGFGFTQSEALKLSTSLARIGADLAAYRGYAGGAEGATMALTQAMFGETERAKMLGIVIRQNSKDFQSLTKSLMNSHGYTESMAKAMATIQIIEKQAANASGAATMDTMANAMKRAGSEIQALRENVGKYFADDVKTGVNVVRDLAKTFNELNPTTQEFIVKTGAIVAGMGAWRTAAGALNIAQALNNKLTADGVGKKTESVRARAGETAAVKAETKALQLQNTVKKEELILKDKEDKFSAAKVHYEGARREARGWYRAQDTALANLNAARAALGGIDRAEDPLRYGEQLSKIKELKEHYKGFTPYVNKATDALNKADDALAAAGRAVEKQKLALQNATFAAKAGSAAIDKVGVSAQNTAVKLTLAQRATNGFKTGIGKIGRGIGMGLDFLGPVGLALIGFEAVKAIYDEFDISGARAVETAQKNIDADMRQLETLRDRESTMKSTFATYQKNLEVLSALSKEERLTNRGRKAAIEIIESLKKANIDLGAVYDENTGKLTLAADAQNRLNEKQKQAAKANLEAQLKSEQAVAKGLSNKINLKMEEKDISKSDIARLGATKGAAAVLKSLFTLSTAPIEELDKELDEVRNRKTKEMESISEAQDANITRIKAIREQLKALDDSDGENAAQKTIEFAKQEIQLKEQLRLKQEMYKFDSLETSADKMAAIQDRISTQKSKITEYRQNAIAGVALEPGQTESWEAKRLKEESKLIDLQRQEKAISKERRNDLKLYSEMQFDMNMHNAKSLKEQIDLMKQRQAVYKSEMEAAIGESDIQAFNTAAEKYKQGAQEIDEMMSGNRRSGWSVTSSAALHYGSMEAYREQNKVYDKDGDNRQERNKSYKTINEYLPMVKEFLTTPLWSTDVKNGDYDKLQTNTAKQTVKEAIKEQIKAPAQPLQKKVEEVDYTKSYTPEEQKLTPYFDKALEAVMVDPEAERTKEAKQIASNAAVEAFAKAVEVAKNAQNEAVISYSEQRKNSESGGNKTVQMLEQNANKKLIDSLPKIEKYLTTIANKIAKTPEATTGTTVAVF
jgi:hypothetical protein|nr:MAG TPA_asm: chromosome segregation ATPase [Caudoviricetes sp.]